MMKADKMRKLIVAAAALALVAAVGVPTVRPSAQTADPPPAPDAGQVPFNPMMGALMNMFIQPRHAKLGLAAREENWPLVEYAFNELTHALAKVATAIPRWKGLPVEELFDAALADPVAMLDAAIKARNPAGVAEAYGRLTTGCNNCHITTDHPFVVLKAPDRSDFPNQAFEKP